MTDMLLKKVLEPMSSDFIRNLDIREYLIYIIFYLLYRDNALYKKINKYSNFWALQ
jgi:hypothetical protein